MSKNDKKQQRMDPLSNSKVMGREGMKIIRNIAFGAYNIYNEGHIFRNTEFVNATIYEVDKKIFEAGIHMNAVRFAYHGTEDPKIIGLLMKDQKAFEAYNLVRQVLVSILETGDTGFLYVLASKLPQYKYNI